MRDGATIVDSAAPMLVWSPGGQVPQYAFREHDLLPELGDAASLLEEVEAGRLYVIDWDKADAWFEEDTRVHVHPHDPYHRIDVRESSRHVVVRIGQTTFCESHRPVLVFETGLPARCYVPRVDVRMDLLEPSDTVTGCAYKGKAAYWHANIDGERRSDVCWSYAYPTPAFQLLADHICFYDERVDELSITGAATTSGPRP